MAMPVATLLRNNFKSWVSARGFLLILFAGLVPMILTGAWVATHQADIEVESLTWSPDPVAAGQNVTFTAVIKNGGNLHAGAFNWTIGVGPVVDASIRVETSDTGRIEGLARGETQAISLSWTARAGIYGVFVQADRTDDVAEVEEFNNVKILPFSVANALPNETAAPQPPGNLTAPGPTAQADAAVAELVWDPQGVRPGQTVNITATIANQGPDSLQGANVTIQIGQVFQNQFFGFEQTTQAVTVSAGDTTTVRLTWDSAISGAFWVRAYVNTTGVAADPNEADNHMARPMTVDPSVPESLQPPELPERLTIKQFYLQILENLHLRILIPFIALFYAGGVISDERKKGTLMYVLTRPIPRWLIPLTKFAAGYLVASVAVLAGIAATFLLLFGATPEGDLGFLTTPLLASLLALFVYGAFFTLLGVLVDRPYLVGVAFVIGWEAIAGNFVPWVEGLTLFHHISVALQGWPLDAGFKVVPEGAAAMEALRNVLLAALVFLAAASVVMLRREFDA